MRKTKHFALLSKNKVVNNATWIIVFNILKSLLAFVIGLLTSRYLGPSNFGVLHYASSVVSFAIPVMNLGFTSTIVKELLDNPEHEGKIIGTAIGMGSITSLLCMAGCFLFVSIANSGSEETIIVCALYSTQLLFQAIELVNFWFQAHLMSKYVSIASIIAYLFVSGYKILLLIFNKDVYWFAVANAIEYACIGMVTFILYLKMSGSQLGFSWELAKDMISRSKFFIISNMMITIFGHTDKIMIELMMDDASTGYYSAAMTLAGITSFVFTAIITSMTPVILENKKTNNHQFEEKVSLTYGLIIYLSLIQSLVMTLLSGPLIQICYGDAYRPAASVLAIVVWYTTFSYLGGVRSTWILAKGFQKYLWVVNLSGAFANIVLNAVLIPIWGMQGAAWASILTQAFTNVIMGYIIKDFRENNRLMVRGLDLKLVFKCIRESIVKN